MSWYFILNKYTTQYPIKTKALHSQTINLQT